eukprot:scaffold19114_cov118-Isochrysis_galbana.AAC.9
MSTWWLCAEGKIPPVSRRGGGEAPHARDDRGRRSDGRLYPDGDLCRRVVDVVSTAEGDLGNGLRARAEHAAPIISACFCRQPVAHVGDEAFGGLVVVPAAGGRRRRASVVLGRAASHTS